MNTSAATSIGEWPVGRGWHGVDYPVGPGWPNGQRISDCDLTEDSSCYWTLTTTDYKDDRISDLEAQVADLEEKLEALEDATGHDIVERPRWEIVEREAKE